MIVIVRPALSKPLTISAFAILFTCVTFLLFAANANAWVIGITPGPKTVYLGIGNSTTNAVNGTINSVSVTVPANVLGLGVVQPMTSNSTQSASPLDGFTVCVPPQQVYIGGYFRQPSTTATVATLQVTTPATLTNGSETIPFSQISWTSTALGNPAADIPAGTFNGGTLFLRNFASNTYVENCHTFSYANTNLVADGVYNGRATYTLSSP